MNGVGHQGSDERMQKNLSVRVDLLESTMADLNELPEQFKELSSQFLELRSDVRDEVSALRHEMVGMRGELRGEMNAMRDELRGEMAETRDELRDEMAAMHTELAGAILLCERRVVAEMRVLHEAVLERIALIGEGRTSAGRRQKPAVPPAGRKRR
jgi:predicted  nucleic acid-binding Zn-ribbon protein